MTAPTVTLTTAAGVGVLTLDNPGRRNALTLDMLTRLEEHLDFVSTEREIRVLIVRGKGSAFSSGADVTVFAAQDRESTWRDWIPRGHRTVNRLATLPQPTIAVLTGDAFGGGLEIALACDFRLAADDVRVGLPEVGLGTLPGWGGTGRLVDIVGMARAKQMILTGLPVDMPTAQTWGLINESAPRALLDDLEQRYLAALMARAPVAQALAKQVLGARDERRSTEVLEALAGALTVTTSDLAEGITAFRAKRAPEFLGG